MEFFEGMLWSFLFGTILWASIIGGIVWLTWYNENIEDNLKNNGMGFSEMRILFLSLTLTHLHTYTLKSLCDNDVKFFWLE